MHNIRAKGASDPKLKEYAGDTAPTWPTFSAGSITKLLGGQLHIHEAPDAGAFSRAWYGAFLAPGFLARA
eukprot:5689474-Lingulodinium_polyedra.AAC.1